MDRTHRASVLVVALLLLATGLAHASVTVYLDRDGEVTKRARIPRFGGGDRVWEAMVACVVTELAPFRIDIVEREPARGNYITVVIGGRPSMMGFGARTTGDSPYTGKVIPNAIDHVFSQAGNGEHDPESLCGVVAHEVGHSLGLDHEIKCDDLMSYSDRCRARHFTDEDAPCGERKARRCDNGDATQSSFRLLATLVGLRADADADQPVARRAHHRRRHRHRVGRS